MVSDAAPDAHSRDGVDAVMASDSEFAVLEEDSLKDQLETLGDQLRQFEEHMVAGTIPKTQLESEWRRIRDVIRDGLQTCHTIQQIDVAWVSQFPHLRRAYLRVTEGIKWMVLRGWRLVAQLGLGDDIRQIVLWALRGGHPRPTEILEGMDQDLLTAEDIRRAIREMVWRYGFDPYLLANPAIWRTNWIETDEDIIGVLLAIPDMRGDTIFRAMNSIMRVLRDRDITAPLQNAICQCIVSIAERYGKSGCPYIAYVPQDINVQVFLRTLLRYVDPLQLLEQVMALDEKNALRLDLLIRLASQTQGNECVMRRVIEEVHAALTTVGTWNLRQALRSGAELRKVMNRRPEDWSAVGATLFSAIVQMLFDRDDMILIMESSIFPPRGEEERYAWLLFDSDFDTREALFERLTKQSRSLQKVPAGWDPKTGKMFVKVVWTQMLPWLLATLPPAPWVVAAAQRVIVEVIQEDGKGMWQGATPYQYLDVFEAAVQVLGPDQMRSLLQDIQVDPLCLKGLANTIIGAIEPETGRELVRWGQEDLQALKDYIAQRIQK